MESLPQAAERAITPAVPSRRAGRFSRAEARRRVRPALHPDGALLSGRAGAGGLGAAEDGGRCDPRPAPGLRDRAAAALERSLQLRRLRAAPDGARTQSLCAPAL